MAQRTKRIKTLMAERPDLVKEFEADIESADRARVAIAAGPYPGIGSGHIDLYKAFAWRNLLLLRAGGAAGVVLPRGALSGSGTEQWRRRILTQGEFRDVVIATNTRGWLFPSIHQQYTVGLICFRNEIGESCVRFAGSFYSHDDFVKGRDSLAVVPADEFETWTGTAAFPLIPDDVSGEVFRQMRLSPSLGAIDGWEFRPIQGDLNTTANRDLFSTNLADPTGPIPVLTGSSFNLWDPDFGAPYAFASPDAINHILKKTIHSGQSKRSAFFGMKIDGESDLPMYRPRIAFRDVCRSNDSRTLICCLVPPGVVLVHPAPYLVRRQGNLVDEAYLLGIMSSIPLDWYVRRLVELHVTFELLSRFPIPRPAEDDGRRTRVAEIAGRLAAKDDRFADWAQGAGVPVDSVSTATERADLEAELDANASSLFGLTRDQVEHVFVTFHRGWNCHPRLERVLTYFDQIETN